jgi:hypothetical protein
MKRRKEVMEDANRAIVKYNKAYEKGKEAELCIVAKNKISMFFSSIFGAFSFRGATYDF